MSLHTEPPRLGEFKHDGGVCRRWGFELAELLGLVVFFFSLFPEMIYRTSDRNVANTFGEALDTSAAS